MNSIGGGMVVFIQLFIYHRVARRLVLLFFSLFYLLLTLQLKKIVGLTANISFWVLVGHTNVHHVPYAQLAYTSKVRSPVLGGMCP